MAIITCENVSMGYEGKVILEDVNFEVNFSDYLCIVGENGSGKSTLMKGILKLKAPFQGKIIFDEGLAPNEIGYLPQQKDTQINFPASVNEVVLSGRLNQRKGKPFYSRADKADADEKMDLTGILSLKNDSFQELSGGQKQRVLLARALCATKKVLLLDEPIAGLDPLITGEIYQLIKKINEVYKITVIMISHDIPMAMKYATKILYLDNKQLFFGSAEEFQKQKFGSFFQGVEHA